jgi:signal transduction histidine kinase
LKQKNAMTERAHRPDTNIWSVIAVYAFFLAAIARTFAWIDDPARLPWFLGFEITFLLLMSWMIWSPGRQRWLHHICVLVEVAIVVGLELLAPEEDFINVLFVLVSYQVGLLFQAGDFWYWAGTILFITCSSLVITTGFLEGIAKSFLNMAGVIIVLAYFVANREAHRAKVERESMLQQLKESNQKLTVYSEQVEELTTLDERNRLARELHDSVSQTLFSITLSTHAAQLLLQKNPNQLSRQLDDLQHLTEAALSEIRTMITQLRPHNG